MLGFHVDDDAGNEWRCRVVGCMAKWSANHGFFRVKDCAPMGRQTCVLFQGYRYDTRFGNLVGVGISIAPVIWGARTTESIFS